MFSILRPVFVRGRQAIAGAWEANLTELSCRMKWYTRRIECRKSIFRPLPSAFGQKDGGTGICLSRRSVLLSLPGFSSSLVFTAEAPFQRQLEKFVYIKTGAVC